MLCNFNFFYLDFFYCIDFLLNDKIVLDDIFLFNYNIKVSSYYLKKIEYENLFVRENVANLQSQTLFLKNEFDKNIDLYLRSKAELENIIKRYKKESENTLKYCLEKFFKDFIVLIDGFEAIVNNSKKYDVSYELIEGINVTHKLLINLCINNRLEQIDSNIELFNPLFHEAVSVVNNTKYKDDFIVECLQKGYLLNDRVIRTSKVVVNKK